MLGFDVCRAANIKITVFWGVMPCGLVNGTNILEQPVASIFTQTTETASFPDMLVPISQTTWCHIAVQTYAD
jgi:hypothetical protein